MGVGNTWASRASIGLAVTASLFGVVSCGSNGGDQAHVDDPSVVRVFAAASLADAFDGLEAAFETINPQYDIELNLAGSSSLRAQILAGAPADVFASANAAIMDEVASDDSVGAEEPEIFATNELTIAVPNGNPGQLSGIDDFARAELFLGLCAVEVPCGSLAEAALTAAGIVPSIDTREPDVRALLAKVAEAELDAGIVYRTDVLAAAERVEAIPLAVDDLDQDEAADWSASYPIVVLGAGEGRDGGREFMSFVLGASGRQILTQYGFGEP
ncbi:MAG: molybdate ABC transporter substrate-binding protein [Acidimicrobiales bacterium]